MKYSASSISMVPTVTPRERWLRNFTHSKNLAGSASKSPALSMRLISSQVWFCVSHTSVVSVPRTARAFSRADLMQLTMDEGLSSSFTMKSITSLALMSACPVVNKGISSLMVKIPSQPACAVLADCGSSAVW